MKRSYLLVLLLLVSSFSSLIPFNTVQADEETPLGFEFLDGGEILRIWNEIDQYYFNVSSGIQFTNHYQDYWTKNVFGIGYWEGGKWNIIKWVDELSSFKRDLRTDWDTYINITLRKDVTITVGPNSYDLRIAIRYHLKRTDGMLTIEPYIKNLDSKDINADVCFAWKIKEIQIGGDSENDQFRTWWLIDENNTGSDIFFLNETSPVTYNNITGFFLQDPAKNMDLQLLWKTKIKDRITTRVTSTNTIVLVNGSTFPSGTEKQTQFWWHDAVLIDSYTEGNSSGNYQLKGLHPSPDPDKSSRSQSFTMLGSNHTITQAKFYLLKNNAPTGYTHAVLYDHGGVYGASSVPSGAALATSEGYDVTTFPGALAILTFTFNASQQYEMNASTKYVIAFENPRSGTIDGTNKTRIGHDSTAPSHDGNGAIYINSGWVTEGAVDAIFYVYGDPVAGNNAPTADSVTITNLVDSDNVYSQHKDYNFNFTVTDADGVAELDFITFALEIGAGWVNGTIDCQSNALNMDVQGNTTIGAVTNSTSGNSASFILPVKTDWDINEASDNDIHFMVNDTVGAGPAMAEKQTDYFDTVNDLVTNAIECTDANNPDRVDISSSITIDFTAYYENDPSSGTASSSYPPDAEFTSISVYNEWDGVLGTDGTIVNGAGSVTGTANASVQSTDYNLYINMADADYVDGEEAATEAVITDRIVAYWEELDDSRVNINANIEGRYRAVLDFDDHPLGAGDTLSVTWGALAWDAGNSWFDISHTEAAVGAVTISGWSGSEATYTITAFTENITETNYIYDSQQLQTLGANNTTPAANETILIYATSQSPYDNHVLGVNDTLILEDTDAGTYNMTYNGTHWIWEGSWPANGTITINTYDSVNETTYIITVLDMNSLSLVITVGISPPPAGNTFDLRVILSEGVGIENANVRLYNSSGDLFSVNTNSTGYIAQQIFDSGNYTLTILRTGFTVYNHTYSWTADVELIVALTLDTELAGMGILPLFLGFMALVVILAAQRRR